VTHSRLAKICSITYTQSPTPSRDKKGILQQFLPAGGMRATGTEAGPTGFRLLPRTHIRDWPE
jgi:hypothetical protein